MIKREREKVEGLILLQVRDPSPNLGHQNDFDTSSL